MNDKSKIRKNWKMVIYVTVLFVLLLIIQDIVKEIYVFNSNIASFEEALNTRIKDELKTDVSYRVKEIELNIENIENSIDEHVIDDLQTLIFSAEELQINLGDQPLSSRQESLKNMVQRYNVEHENHCYYIIDNLGRNIYDCKLNEFTSNNIYDSTDFYNREYIKNIIEEIALENESLIYYFIQNDEGEIEKIIDYSVYDPFSGYIVGISVIYENYNDYAKNELLYTYAHYYDDEENKILLLSDVGEVLYSNQDNIINLNIIDLPGELSYIKEIYDFGLETNEGFTEYKLEDTSETTISYVKYIPDWNLIISSSKSNVTYDYLVDDFTTQNYNYTIIIKIPIYLVLMYILIVIYRKVRRNMELSEIIYKQEESLYMRFADYSLETIVITNKIGDILFVNKLGRDIFFRDVDESLTINLNEVLVEESGYYTIYSTHETYHIKYNVESISYDGEEADLYIMQDVTDEILSERKLQALTLADDLTKLGNRRLLVQDFNTDISAHIKSGNTAYLVMLDLDNFKEANDKYGHKFGDYVLLKIANIFKENSPQDTKIYRVGGDEFSILSKNWTIEELLQALEKINALILNFDFGKKVHISFSAGVATMNVNDKKRRLSDYYEKADKKLYEAKEAGKNIIKY